MSHGEAAAQYYGPPISLTIFQGPLDLLAYLVRTREVDIQEVAVAEISGQFVAFVRAMQVINIEEAAEYLPVAAALVLWKVRSLLPHDEDEEPEELADVLEDVARSSEDRMAEYRAFRGAAEQLRQAHALQQQVYVRSLDEDEIESGWIALDEVHVFDMVSALARVLQRVDEEPAPVLLRPKWSVREQVSFILERLRQSDGPVLFEDLFETATDRLWVVCTFLALLEMVRRGRVKTQAGEGRRVLVSLT